MSEGTEGTESTEVANRLLAKLRTFVSNELDDEESKMFASLLAPGVSLAYGELGDGELVDDEVTGFGVTSTAMDSAGVGDDEVQWHSGALAQALAAAMRQSGLRVTGLRD